MIKINDAIKKLFDKYATSKVINPDGLEKICSELGIDLYEDNFVLYFLYKCNCKTYGEVTIDEFAKGMSAFSVQNISDLKKKIPQNRIDLADINKPDFTSFWKFIFVFNLEKKKTILPLDICNVYILKFMGNYPVSKEFLEFLKKEKKELGLNSDQWQCFLEFIKTLGKVFPKDYNVDEAWPFLFDEFYYSYCEKRGKSLDV